MTTGNWKIKRRTQVAQVSALGCLYKSTKETNEFGESIEHIELWTEEEDNEQE